MATTISERLHDWLARMWNGETSLITDDAWLPNPTGEREQAMGTSEPRVRGLGSPLVGR